MNFKIRLNTKNILYGVIYNKVVIFGAPLNIFAVSIFIITFTLATLKICNLTSVVFVS